MNSKLEQLIKDSIIPLYDKAWVMSTIRELYTAEVTDDDDVGSEYYDEEIAYLERVLKDSDGSIVVGCPPLEVYDSYDEVFALGLVSEGWLDDQGMLDQIMYEHWKALNSSDIIEIGVSESMCGFIVPEDMVTEFGAKAARKLAAEVLTTIIGMSLTDPNNKVLLPATKDCAAFLKEKYNAKNPKRTSKRKWGVLEFRAFNDKDKDESYTIVTYNDVLISHYEFAFDLDH